jgi:two-component system, OmpR family, heavy metal sensor histidine kinase CusS
MKRSTGVIRGGPAGNTRALAVGPRVLSWHLYRGFVPLWLMHRDATRPRRDEHRSRLPASYGPIKLKRHEKQFDAALAWTAHEIKEPLLVTKFAISSVLASGTLGEVERQVLRRSEQILERLALDVQHILCWAFSDGTGALESESMDLAEIIRAAVNWTLAFRERDRVVLDLSEGMHVLGDRALLRGAIANLVRNALDYSQEESEVHVSLSAHGAEAVITVRNAGSLAFDESEMIFSRFARGSEGVLLPNGSGLGLFITRRVVQAHGGRISIESTQQDTRFSMFFTTETL